jgi:hypothetical protein
MANIFFSGEKAPEEEAKRQLEKHVRGVCDLVHTVRFESDDGGKHIVLYVEVENPADFLEPYIKDALHTTKWMGWRHMIMKCPPGSIGSIIKDKE